MNGPEGYCASCNRIVATYDDDILFEHFRGAVRDYGAVDSKNHCPGSGKPAWPMPDSPEVDKFAFKVRPERPCRRVGDLEEHKAHEYRYNTTFWCAGYERPW